MKTLTPLLDAEDSIFFVIDVQDKFLERLDQDTSDKVVERICWLAKVANWLEIPTIVTAEEISVMGPTNESVRSCVGAENKDLNKEVFGLAGQRDILEQVTDIGRNTAVLVGLETDVCVAQSALGLASEGLRVAVVSDACASPQRGHEHGLARLRDAGITIISTKGLFFEWVRDLEKCHSFFRASGIGMPKDLYIG